MAMQLCCTGLGDWEARLDAISSHVSAPSNAATAPADASAAAAASPTAALRKFSVSFDDSMLPEGKISLDGRLILIIAVPGDSEPRNTVSTDGASTSQIFGIDVDGLKPGDEAVIDASVFGAPLASVADLPAGEYDIQAVLHIYETYNLSTGHTVKLPSSEVLPTADPSPWNSAPGECCLAPVCIVFYIHIF